MANAEILSFDQYSERAREGFHTPYIVELEAGDQKLLFYGSNHVNDPANPQFVDLETRWATFRRLGKDPIILVEGHFDQAPEEDTIDRDTSIIEGGEAQLMVYIARRDNALVASPEPDQVWEANELVKEFGREKVLFYYFMRYINLWNGFTQKPDIPGGSRRVLEAMKEQFQWKDVDFSLDNMESIHKTLLGRPFDSSDVDWVNTITDPTNNEYVTNELSRRSSELRDEYIIQQIQHYWSHKRSIFAVFGSAHAVRLEGALRKLDL